MVQTQLDFKNPPKMQEVRYYRDVQKSVNLLFRILEEYGRLEKNLAELKNLDSNQGLQKTVIEKNDLVSHTR